ncbi:uncharacterized protein LOC135146406 [Zophobas morio]|uniref:uncharacterized protein LOC135146406 n=1 Tax=Zophobas morio TaxID=2755281 RepID=UPI0030831D1E
MINISPIGRNCSYKERLEFHEYDKVHRIRETMITDLQHKFPEMDMQFSIGGQISFDCFPVGWDKTFCLRHLQKHDFRFIHFYGDKSEEGGNDHELFCSKKTIGHAVTSPEHTAALVEKQFGPL